MKNIRIIPRLDIKGPNLVKGIHLEGLRVLGKPETFARYYYEQGADELLYVDVVASLYNRNSILPVIERTAKEIFIPLTVAGGLRTIDDIKAALRAGADKVALNTAALKNPGLIQEAAERFGSSTIVVAIEAIRSPDGRYFAYTDNGRESTGVDVLGWASRVAELGAGEILLTSVDRDGTRKGFDIELTRLVSDAVSIPVIACGGAGEADHVRQAVSEGHADAVSAASIFHYDCIEHNPLEGEYDAEGNIEFMKHRKEQHGHRASIGLRELKKYLYEHGVPCRYESGT